MENEVGDTLKIAIEIIIAALLIGMVALFGSISYSAYNTKISQDATTDYMNSISELYYFNGKTVSGSDALELMMTYTRTYDYYFEFYDGLGNLVDIRKMDSIGEKAYGNYLEYWSETNMRNVVNGYETELFTSTLVKDLTGTKVEGILFVKGGG